MTRVRNLVNTNGNEVKNQFVIFTEDKVVFQSYQSIVAVYQYDGNILILGRDWDYSNTTLKHLYRFLDKHTNINMDSYSKKLIQKAIDNEVIFYDERVY